MSVIQVTREIKGKSHNDFTLLVNQTFANIPKLYLLLGRFDTRLRTLQQPIDQANEQFERFNIWMVRLRVLQSILQDQVDTRQTRHRTRDKRRQVTLAGARISRALRNEILVLRVALQLGPVVCLGERVMLYVRLVCRA